MSLDGVVEAPEKWSSAYFSPEIMQSIQGRQAAGDALLLGRVTYQTFQESFADQTSGPADWMNRTPKYVVSTTLDTADWDGSTLIGEKVAEQIADLKQQDGKNIVVSGSTTLVRWLIHEKLLDELHLTLFPTVAGSGKRLFEDGGAPAGFKLAASEAFSTGVLSLNYELA